MLWWEVNAHAQSVLSTARSKLPHSHQFDCNKHIIPTFKCSFNMFLYLNSYLYDIFFFQIFIYKYQNNWRWYSLWWRITKLLEHFQFASSLASFSLWQYFIYALVSLSKDPVKTILTLFNKNLVNTSFKLKFLRQWFYPTIIYKTMVGI